MLYDLSGVLPFFVVIALLAVAGAVASLTVLGREVTHHHRVRVARHQSIPTYYRRLVLAH
ncbi:hypothetical protein G5V58_04565 [Nocardioides anomalus]|uniref:Uncharacterized protein n=1 Tax=Nocardioides anomalus TaxID=2712223 RepID=A0A6G6WAF0_9ACTN|nr:hypothetical protein [Nocardioides anomalus]QIG42137.1 hypothetical protein G5V58_04565 [Nocardioides anomalus]